MDSVNNKDLSRVTRNKANSFYIDSNSIRTCRCVFISALMSNEYGHSDSFDKTIIRYVKDEEECSIETNNTLGSEQLLVLLYAFRLLNMEVISIKHVGNSYGYKCTMELDGLNDGLDLICFKAPDGMDYNIDRLIDSTSNNRLENSHKVYKIDIDGANIGDIVTLVNRIDCVIGVTKTVGDGDRFVLIESEKTSIAVTSENIIVTELKRGGTAKKITKYICKKLNVHPNNVCDIIMM